jgi:integrase
MSFSAKVQIWKIYTYKGKRKNTHHVIWAVAGKRQKEVFDDLAGAERFRAELVVARGNGEEFAIASGLPKSKLEAIALAEATKESVRWYRLACEYVDQKWPGAAPNYRRSIAEALVDAAEAYFQPETKPAFDLARVRAVLWKWSFSGRLHGHPLGERDRPVVEWLEANTIEVPLLGDRAHASRITGAALRRIATRKTDGKPTAPTTFRRKRNVLFNLHEYAVERGLLDVNPMTFVKRKAPKPDVQVDPVTVPNEAQAKRLLAAIEADSILGRRLAAFFATMYYAGLRPEEVTALRATTSFLSLPKQGVGRMRLTNAEPPAGPKWTDGQTLRAFGPLKPSAWGKHREVPLVPELCQILREHRSEFRDPVSDRVFVGPRGGVPTAMSIGRLWRRARAEALTESELAIGLAATPYHLRHACVSSWLAAGVHPPQVAAWAGHSVETLLRVYAKCIDNTEQDAIRRLLPPDPTA